MMYLIGGAPKAGKTFLANKIAKQKNGKVIELDNLMPKWNSAVSSKDFSKKLPVWQAKKDNQTPTIQDYQIESQTYWTNVKLLLDSELMSNNVVIVEGAQLSPKLLRHWLGNLSEEASRNVEVIYLSYDTAPLNSEFIKEAEVYGFKIKQRVNE